MTACVLAGHANLQFLDQSFNGLDWQAELQVLLSCCCSGAACAHALSSA